MKVLVFGGTGWVGHKISQNFVAENYDVTICSRGKYSAFHDNIKNIRSIIADKSNEDEVKKVLQDNRYDIIIDSVPTEESINAVFRHAKGLKHYIHCSSTGGYAPLPFLPCDETALYEGYASGWKKIKKPCDNLVLKYHLEEGFPATVIRPCYITGKGELPICNLGYRRDDFIQDIINGKEIELPNDGKALLQPIRVEDLAHSFVLAAKYPQKSIGQIFNICLEKAVTLNRYIEITASVFNKSPNIVYRSVDELINKYSGTIDENGIRFLAEHMCFDISKAKSLLSFKPSCTTEQAIEETAIWAAKHQGLI